MEREEEEEEKAYQAQTRASREQEDLRELEEEAQAKQKSKEIAQRWYDKRQKTIFRKQLSELNEEMTEPLIEKTAKLAMKDYGTHSHPASAGQTALTKQQMADDDLEMAR